MFAKVVLGTVLVVALAGGSAEAAKGKQRRLPGLKAFTAFLTKGRAARKATRQKAALRPAAPVAAQAQAKLTASDVAGMHTTSESTRPDYALAVVTVHFKVKSGATVKKSVSEILASGDRDLIDLAQMSVNSAIEDHVSQTVFGRVAGLELKTDNLRIANNALLEALGQ
ncbi:MAG TPA: hypothetical protein VMZ28_16150 [Kofleriaceae bacterium]|nr:hypothetical protein [Kofleriaceae bacterium]